MEPTSYVQETSGHSETQQSFPRLQEISGQNETFYAQKPYPVISHSTPKDLVADHVIITLDPAKLYIVPPNYIPRTRTEQTAERSKKSMFLKYRGILLALASSLCFSLAALLVTYLKDDYARINIAAWRFQGSYFLAVPLMTCHHLHLHGRRLRLRLDASALAQSKNVSTNKYSSIQTQLKTFGMLLLRSILTCNAFLLSFYALKYLAVGDVLAICSSTPVFVYIFAYLVLRERCGIVPIAASLIVVTGVVCILRPPILIGSHPIDENAMTGTSLAFASVILSALANILLRCTRNIHYSTATFVFGAWGTIESITLALVFGSVLTFPKDLLDWTMSAALGVLTFLGQISIILALKYEKAGPVSLIRSVDVLFGYAGQVLFWNVVPDRGSLVGATMVCFAVGMIGVRKWVGSLPEKDSRSLKLDFMLK